MIGENEFEWTGKADDRKEEFKTVGETWIVLYRPTLELKAELVITLNFQQRQSLDLCLRYFITSVPDGWKKEICL